MKSVITCALTLLAFVSATSAQEIICVSSSAPPPGYCRDVTLPSGQVVTCVDAALESITGNACWDNAYNDLQDALNEAAALAEQGNIVEIWVAAGTYHPDRGTGDRDMSFQLHKNVEIYGGFAGWESFRFQRDFVKNETILSGDLNEDDNPDGSFDGGVSNCCTEHDAPGCDDPVCEALRCPKDSPRENECCTRGWSSKCARNASIECCNLCSTRNDCDNALNVMTSFDTDTTAIVDGFIVTSGRADSFSSAVGAGIRIEDGGATLKNCTFRNNVAGSITTVYANNSDVIVKNCLITDNKTYPHSHASAFGSLASGSAIVEDTIFYRNAGGGLGLVADWGTVQRTTFIENNGTAVTVGFLTRATIDDSRFIRNSILGSVSSAGINTSSNSHTTITNCEFIGNIGTAMNNRGFMALFNCLFDGNRSGGGAVFFNGFGGSATLENCTFVDNEIGGIEVDFGLVKLKHCIFWNNRGFGGDMPLYAQVTTFFDGIARASYTVLQGYDGPDGTFPGPGNTGADPMFVDEDGPDNIPGNEDDDLRLRSDSPLIDAGDPNATLRVDRDLDGHTRVLCDRVDFGPYEFGIGDFDCNGQADVSDLADLPACMTNPGDTTTTAPCNAFDFNADKAVDLSDFAAMQETISEQ